MKLQVLMKNANTVQRLTRQGLSTGPAPKTLTGDPRRYPTYILLAAAILLPQA